MAADDVVAITATGAPAAVARGIREPVGSDTVPAPWTAVLAPWWAAPPAGPARRGERGLVVVILAGPSPSPVVRRIAAAGEALDFLAPTWSPPPTPRRCCDSSAGPSWWA
ncbi:MAG: hypothetical protein ACRDZW_10705 [Acidimicrobiales bacterium]